MKMSIGNTDPRTSGLFTSLIGGTVPGLFSAASHTSYETDGSLAYDDAYSTPGGTTSQFNSTLWVQRVASATDDFGGVFGPDWIARESAFSPPSWSP
jgi:unspecific peroxygenase